MSISTESRHTVSSTNVLIVDDHDLVAMSLALCLRSQGLHRQHFIDQYRRQQEQARAVENRLARLTDKEHCVLERLARGRRAQAMADEFGVSLATIRTQIRAVLQKLNVSGQLEAVALLNEH